MFNINENYLGNYKKNFTIPCFGELTFTAREAITALSFIILVILLLVGIGKKNITTSLVGFFVFTAVLLLMYFPYVTINQLVFLGFLLILEFGLMIYFGVNESKITYLNNRDYPKFYLPGNKDGNKLKYYDGNERVLRVMEGGLYSYVKRDELKNDYGKEFSYSFWLKVCPDNFAQSNKKWRVVFVRGLMSGNEDEIFKNKTPGVYLAPNSNQLIMNVAIEDGPDENNAIVLDNIPLNEWFCITMVLEGKSFDCYVNGLLERSINLTGQARFFNSDLVKGKSGFNGLMAYFRYHAVALTPEQVMKKFEAEKRDLAKKEPLEICFKN